MPTIEQIAYGGWSRCRKISNGKLDLIVTEEVGPRIIHLALPGQGNLFCEVEAHMGNTGSHEWLLYGGHRFWHAPEAQPRTYFPDNAPVKIEEHADFLRVTQDTETTTGVQKQLDIAMSDDSPHVKVTHRMTNHNMWAVNLAPWALSVMTTGGVGVIPFPPRGTHPEDLQPANSLTLWPYTDMSDARWTWGERYILLRQQPGAATPQKVGVDVRDNWSAYVVNGQAFVKVFQHQADKPYPDLGASVEIFTNDFMFELETLGPLTTIEPGESVEHVEDWFVFADVNAPSNDTEVDAHLLPLAKQALAAR